MEQEPEIYSLPLKDLESNEAQTRLRLNQDQINDLAAVLRAGGELEPAVVFKDGATYYLASGFHRREAHRKEGRKHMLCVVKHGTLWDAIEFGIQDNKCWLGARVTNADKAAAVCKVLKIKPDQSDRKIAELCGVSHATVIKYRKQLEATGQIDQLSSHLGKDRKTRQVPQQKCVHSLEVDRCSCGAEWTSDGNGERFCEKCGETHPRNASSVEASRSPKSNDDRFPPKALVSKHSVNKPDPTVPEIIQECKKHLILLTKQVSPLSRLSRRIYDETVPLIDQLYKLFEQAEKRLLRQAEEVNEFLQPIERAPRQAA